MWGKCLFLAYDILKKGKKKGVSEQCQFGGWSKGVQIMWHFNINVN